MAVDHWTTRVWREFRVRNLTRTYRDVLLKLGAYARNGTAFPSHATLASRAGCSERTVRRTLQHARLLGLLDWSERRVRRSWRWLRTSNLYQLILPDGAVQPGLRPSWLRAKRTTGQDHRQGEREVLECPITSLLWIQTARSAPDLLAARRIAMSKRLLEMRSA
jgi:AraC-like DNA-binding protein